MNNNKTAFVWKDCYNLENEQVDLQHRKLFDLANGIVEACAKGSDEHKLQETINFLVNYTIRHFHYEEELQKQYNYPDYNRHRALHEDFRITVSNLILKFKEGGSTTELSDDVNLIVVRWLINHIQREDKKIGDHIRLVSEANKKVWNAENSKPVA